MKKIFTLIALSISFIQGENATSLPISTQISNALSKKLNFIRTTLNFNTINRMTNEERQIIEAFITFDTLIDEAQNIKEDVTPGFILNRTISKTKINESIDKLNKITKNMHDQATIISNAYQSGLITKEANSKTTDFFIEKYCKIVELKEQLLVNLSL